jgi:SAM-dependent methyltransferase
MPVFTEKCLYLTKRAVFRMSPTLARKLNLDFRLHAPSRQFLEKQVFGLLNSQSDSQASRVNCLFIGLDKHNWHYPGLLDMNFHSIDIKPTNAVYGPPGRHMLGSALTLSQFYERDAFDIVIANGLIGFGVDEEGQFNQLMAQIHGVLADAGLLILGYNDRPDRLSFRVEGSEGYDLYEPFVPPIAGVSSAHHKIPDSFEHKYVFMRKRPGNWPGRRSGLPMMQCEAIRR